MQIYLKSHTLANLLHIANIDSYGDKNFSELHAMWSGIARPQRGDIWVGYARLVAT